MGRAVNVKDWGEGYVPTAWEDLVGDMPAPKVLSLDSQGGLNAALKQIRLGASVLVTGSWANVLGLLQALESRRKELLASVERTDRVRRSAREWDAIFHRILARVLVAVAPNSSLDTTPPIPATRLVQFFGDLSTAASGLPLLVPAVALRSLLSALQESFPVPALEARLYAPQTVLQPRQQEVYELFRDRLLALRGLLSDNLVVLDMGCGSGALALLAAKVLWPRVASVVATDCLPEALATTWLNAEKLASEGAIAPGIVRVTEGGDLYAPVADQRFDLIAFNPPWANAMPRTRLEVARFDYEQRTVARFLEETPRHLREGGRLLLFYADQAGPKAIASLLKRAEESGFRLLATDSRRIRVAQRWEHIYLYDMGLL